MATTIQKLDRALKLGETKAMLSLDLDGQLTQQG
jgi:hypothetical protein